MRPLLPFILVATGCAGAPTTRPSPPALPVQAARQPERAVGLAAGAMHTCAVYADGFVSCWGTNKNGRLGQEARAEVAASWSPMRVQGLEEVTRVSAGHRHTCALNVLGEVWCWGANDLEQLGDGTTSSRSVPTRAPLPGAASAVRAHGARTCATSLEDASRSWCWGDGEGVELQPSSPPDAAALRMWRLDAAGQPLRAGEDLPVMQLPTDGRVVQGALFVELVEGLRHACMRTRDGAIWCAGENGSGQLGVGSRAVASASEPVEQPRLTCSSVQYVRGSRYCAMTSPYLDDPSGTGPDGRLHANPSPRTWRHGPAIEVDHKTGQIVARGRYDRGSRAGWWEVSTPDGRARGRGELQGEELDARVGSWEFEFGGERQWGAYGAHHRPVGEWNWTRSDGTRFVAMFDGSGEQTRWAVFALEKREYEVELTGDYIHLTAGKPGRGWGALRFRDSLELPDPWVPGVVGRGDDTFAYAFPLVDYVRDALDIDEDE